MLEDIEKSENTRDELDKKIVDLEVEILRNESHIESQNKNIEDIHGDVKSAIDRLNIDKIEENNFKLGEKIKYLEEVFEKFNEKELLNENIITEPSSTDNNDSLTPLDKNFVTLDQLQNHYRLFINRIQQQLASFGGGGEVRLEFLDDVDRDSAKVNGKFLKYDSVSGKWVGANASGGSGGSQTLDNTLGLGNTSSLGMSVGIVTSTKLHIDSVGSGVTFNEDLVVVGDARVTGILSIGTSSIVLDPNAKTISGVEELQVGETTIKNDSEGNIIFVNTFNPTQTINVGIGSTVSVNTTGIITASSFTGSLIGTASNATNLNNQSASHYLDYNNFNNVPTALSSFSNDVGFVTSSVVVGYATEGFVSNLVSISTFSGNYNDLTNTPTALSSFSNDVGFVTSSVVVGYATEGFVNSAVAGIVSSAPATLDTLNELAQALDDDANFSTTVTNLIGTKASLSGATFTGIVTATSFVKSSNSGGFLKADGTEDTNTYLTSFTETNDLSSAVTWTNVPNANITESSVTQHQAALSITESQISDLQSYLTSYTETQTLDDVLGLGNTSTTGLSVGVVTTTALKGFEYLQAPHGTSVNIDVKVITKTAVHRYNGTGSSSGYTLNGVESPFLTLTPGRTYNFKQDDSSNLGHPFRFYLEADKTTQYTEGVTSVGTPGNANSMTSIEVTDETPVVLHYQCSAHGYMGNAVQVNSNKVNTPYQIDGLKGANIAGVVTATSFVKSSNSGGFLKADGTEDTNTYLTSYTETDPVVGAISGIVKADGVGNISAATAGTDYLTPSGDGSSLTGLTGASAATYGSSSVTPIITVDTIGRITGISTAAISGGSGGGISNVVEDTTPQLGGTLDTNGNLIQFGDSSSATDDRLQFGASQDLQIYHDGNNSRIHNTTQGHLVIRQEGLGDLYLENTYNDRDVIIRTDDGSGNTISYIRCEGDTGEVGLYHYGSKKLATTSSGVTITGIITASSFVKSGGTSSQYLMADGSVTTSGGGGDTVSIESSATDILSVSSGAISADDAGADKLVFWDDSAGKLTYLTVGSNLTVTDTTIAASGGGGGGGAIGIQSGGTEITSSAGTINFVGTGITMADDGSVTDITIPSATRTTNRYIATANQTTFSATYTVGYVDVFLNGIKLDGQDEFTATNGTSVVLTDGATVNDIVEIVAQQISANLTITGISNVVEDTTPQLGGDLDVNGKNISGTGDVNLTGIVTATTFSGGTFSGNVDLSGLLKEGVNITAGKLSDNTDIDLANGMVHLFTTEETTTSTPNLVFGGSSVNAKMNIGEAITVVIITTADATGYSAELTIDSSAVTEEWLGGEAPSEGGAGGYDVYTHNIIKTADATYVVLSNLVNFA